MSKPRAITEKDLQILQWVRDHPGCSTTALYVANSPSCQRRGLKRSQGIDGWTRRRTMPQRGLVKIVRDTSRCRSGEWHRDRFLVAYRWFVTEKGLQALQGLIQEA